MNTKKNLSAVFLSVAMFIAGVGAGFCVAKLPQSDIQTQKPSDASNVWQAHAKSDLPQTDMSNVMYLIKIDNGRVGIFKFDSAGNPVLQYYSDQINVNAVRAQDKKKLEEGIMVHGNEELAAILEDFSS